MEQIITESEAEVQNNRAVFASLDKVDRELASLNAANKAIGLGAAQPRSGVVLWQAGSSMRVA